ncbi:MAG TPA: hypothetical protein VGB88_06725 [Alphaproteobacteria bacterium]
MAKIDEGEWRKRLERISQMFADMVGHAEELSQHRCPYRDRHDRCTAHFRCRSQLAQDAADKPALCTHDGSFDYRLAWESDPATYDRAKRRIADAKRGPRRARRRAGDTPGS